MWSPVGRTLSTLGGPRCVCGHLWAVHFLYWVVRGVCVVTSGQNMHLLYRVVREGVCGHQWTGHSLYLLGGQRCVWSPVGKTLLYSAGWSERVCGHFLYWMVRGVCVWSPVGKTLLYSTRWSEGVCGHFLYWMVPRGMWPYYTIQYNYYKPVQYIKLLEVFPALKYAAKYVQNVQLAQHGPRTEFNAVFKLSKVSRL